MYESWSIWFTVSTAKAAASLGDEMRMVSGILQDFFCDGNFIDARSLYG